MSFAPSWSGREWSGKERIRQVWRSFFVSSRVTQQSSRVTQQSSRRVANMPTTKGMKLAIALNRIDPQSLELCSKICRAATSYARIQEDVCNGHPAQSWLREVISIERLGKLQADWEA